MIGNKSKPESETSNLTQNTAWEKHEKSAVVMVASMSLLLIACIFCLCIWRAREREHRCRCIIIPQNKNFKAKCAEDEGIDLDVPLEPLIQQTVHHSEFLGNDGESVGNDASNSEDTSKPDDTMSAQNCCICSSQTPVAVRCLDCARTASSAFQRAKGTGRLKTNSWSTSQPQT